MNQNLFHHLRVLFAVLDLLILNLVFYSTKLFFNTTIPVTASGDYLNLCLFSNFAWVVSGWVSSIYDSKYTASFEIFVGRSLKGYLLFLITVLVYLYFMREVEVSRLFTSIFFICFLTSVLVNRLLYLLSYLYFREKEYLVKRILIIGHNEASKKLANYLESQGPNMQIVGFCEEERNISELSHYPILSMPDKALQISGEYGVNEIYSTILPEQDKRIYALMKAADQACIRFKLVPDLNHFVKMPMHLTYFSDIPVLSQRSEPLDDLVNRVKKRLFDIVLSVIIIVFVLSWLIPLISFLIWLESGGPIFFIQKRSGVNNKPFNCLKFRSMKTNKDSDLKQASKDDNRFTKIGRILRKTNLDEFPQFFNVLIGQMSIVGPRPHMLKHTEDFAKMYDQYMIRQFLKPGITGWAQVHGYRGEIHSVEDIRNRVEHDIWYLENWNQWIDLKIMFLTVYNMIKGEENAY